VDHRHFGYITKLTKNNTAREREGERDTETQKKEKKKRKRLWLGGVWRNPKQNYKKILVCKSVLVVATVEHLCCFCFLWVFWFDTTCLFVSATHTPSPPRCVCVCVCLSAFLPCLTVPDWLPALSLVAVCS